MQAVRAAWPAVDHVELHVPQECVCRFIGPNGAGKSTTMKMLLGLIHPTAGRVRLLGRELTEKNRLPLLPDRQPDWVPRRVSASDRTGKSGDRSRLKGVPHTGHWPRAGHCASDAGPQPPGRAVFARPKQRPALPWRCWAAKLLILDEPTNGLDPPGIQEMLIRHARRHGRDGADLEPSLGRDGTDGQAGRHHRPQPYSLRDR